MFLPRPVPLLTPRVGGRGGCCLLGGVSFPVIFVYFRFAPELNIFLGIVRLCCDFLLDCLAVDVIGADFLSITRLGFPAARAVPALMASWVVLLAWLLYIYLCRWGNGISSTVRVRPLIAWTRSLTRFLFCPPLRRISCPGFFL